MATNNALVTTKEAAGKFMAILDTPEQTAKLQSLLGPGVTLQKFKAVTMLAVQQSPDLLGAAINKTSLFLSLQQAAKSGLVPDKKEGALVIYGKDVQWQVMIGGIRKILARNGFDLRAEVVYENDTFDYELGDNPRIDHHRPKLGEKRGEPIGAYAIARGPDGRLYRDVMDKEEIEKVRSVSRAKSSGPWVQWPDEMWKKTVGRRLVKSLPIYEEDEALKEAIEQDNAHFDLGNTNKPEPSKAAQAAAAAARAAAPAAKAEPAVEGEFTEVTDEAQADAGQQQPDVAAADEPDPFADIPF